MSDNTSITIIFVAICFSMAWCAPRLASENPAAVAAKCSSLESKQ